MRALGAGPTAWARWLAGTLLSALLVSCARAPGEPVVVTWMVGQAEPQFDPSGPPDPVRWALERMLSRGLVREDSSGAIVMAAAETVSVSPDGLRYSFRLRPGLTFADGAPCNSRHFAAALESGLNRLDHATYSWLLSAVAGMDRVRAGKPLPALGIATPDARTLILRLQRPDSSLLRLLAFPGVAVPWRKPEAVDWGDGIGEYRLVRADAGRFTLARRGRAEGRADTVHVRFVPGAARTRAALRTGSPDLLWPVPPDLLDQPLPSGYHAMIRPANPVRRLLLVLREDLPPTSRAPARQALAHGLDREAILEGLGALGTELAEWWAGAGPFEFPPQDPEQVQAWLERGDLGRSLHVVMSYSADGVGARIARSLQGAWARNGLDVELRVLRQPKPVAEALQPGGAHLHLIEAQSLLDRPEADLAELVMPLRGPAIGGFRTGWRTREFDPWILRATDAPLDLAYAQQRIAEERAVIPLAGLPWVWVEREGAGPSLDPRFGPDPGSLRASTEQVDR